MKCFCSLILTRHLSNGFQHSRLIDIFNVTLSSFRWARVSYVRSMEGPDKFERPMKWKAFFRSVTDSWAKWKIHGTKSQPRLGRSVSIRSTGSNNKRRVQLTIDWAKRSISRLYWITKAPIRHVVSQWEYKKRGNEDQVNSKLNYPPQSRGIHYETVSRIAMFIYTHGRQRLYQNE